MELAVVAVAPPAPPLALPLAMAAALPRHTPALLIKAQGLIPGAANATRTGSAA